jgi:hypothetical protein
MTTFWDTAPCSVVEVDGRLRGSYCLHDNGDDGGCTHHCHHFGPLQRDYTALISGGCLRNTRRHENLKPHRIKIDCTPVLLTIEISFCTPGSVLLGVLKQIRQISRLEFYFRDPYCLCLYRQSSSVLLLLQER